MFQPVQLVVNISALYIPVWVMSFMMVIEYNQPSSLRKPPEVKLPEGRSERESVLSKAQRVTRSLFPKEAPEVPEGSNFFLNVLREASPLAA